MKLSQKVLSVRYMQDGGAMSPAAPEEAAPMGPAPEGAPAEGAPAGPEGGQDQVMQQLAQMAQEIIRQMGPEAAAMLAQIIMEMLQGAGGGQAQVPPEEEQPVFQRNGGKLVRIR